MDFVWVTIKFSQSACFLDGNITNRFFLIVIIEGAGCERKTEQ